MNLYRFTKLDGEEIWINVDLIRSVRSTPLNNNTQIEIGKDDFIMVTQDVDHVVQRLTRLPLSQINPDKYPEGYFEELRKNLQGIPLTHSEI